MANTQTASTGLFVVQLANRGNPDHGQDPSRSLPGADEDQEVAVISLDQASAVCQRYIRTRGLGAGNWAGGEVRTLGGTPVARVAYNGRVFAFTSGELLQEAADPTVHAPATA